jgi:hypothetical protein
MLGSVALLEMAGALERACQVLSLLDLLVQNYKYWPLLERACQACL